MYCKPCGRVGGRITQDYYLSTARRPATPLFGLQYMVANRIARAGYLPQPAHDKNTLIEESE